MNPIPLLRAFPLFLLLAFPIFETRAESNPCAGLSKGSTLAQYESCRKSLELRLNRIDQSALIESEFPHLSVLISTLSHQIESLGPQGKGAEAAYDQEMKETHFEKLQEIMKNFKNKELQALEKKNSGK